MQFAFLQLKRKVSSEFSVPSIFQQTFKQTISMINEISNIFKPASPEFRGCLDRDVSSCLVRDWEQKSIKEKGGKSYKTRDGKNEGVFVLSVSRAFIVANPCKPSDCRWRIRDLPEVPVRDCICHGHLEIRKLQISRQMSVVLQMHFKFHLFHLSDFTSMFQLFHHFVALKDVNVKSQIDLPCAKNQPTVHNPHNRRAPGGVPYVAWRSRGLQGAAAQIWHTVTNIKLETFCEPKTTLCFTMFHSNQKYKKYLNMQKNSWQTPLKEKSPRLHVTLQWEIVRNLGKRSQVAVVCAAIDIWCTLILWNFWGSWWWLLCFDGWYSGNFKRNVSGVNTCLQAQVQSVSSYQDAVSVLQVLFPHPEENNIIESHTFVYVYVVQEQDTGKEVFKIIWKVGLLYHAGSLALGSALVTFLFAGDPGVQFGGILWKCTFFCSLKSHTNRNTLKHMKHVAMWLWSFGFCAKLLKPAKGQTWQQSAAVEGRLHHLKVWYTAESWYS